MKTIVLIVLTFFVSIGVDAQYKVGDKVDDFKLKGIDGKYVSMADYKNAEGIIVIFTCNTCPVAIKYEDRIVAMHNKYSAMGFPVVAINSNCVKKKPGDSMDAMKERAGDKDFSFAYLRDDSQEVAKKFGAERTPEVYLVNKTDKGMYLAYTGAIDNNVDDPGAADKHYVADAINDLKNGKNIAVTDTRAVGCTIKWME